MSSKTCSLRKIRRTDSKRTPIYPRRSLKSSPSWLRQALIKYPSSSLALARLLTKTRVWCPKQRSAMKVSFQSICRRSECPLFAQVQKYICQSRSLKLSQVLLAENNRDSVESESNQPVESNTSSAPPIEVTRENSKRPVRSTRNQNPIYVDGIAIPA